MRRIVIFLIALAAFSGSVIAALATQQERDFQLRGYVDASQDANLPYHLPRMGVNVALTQYDPQQLRLQLDMMEDAGVVWLRQTIRWTDVETEPDKYNWDQWDHIIDVVNDYANLRIVAVLTTAPQWTHPLNEEQSVITPPDDPEAFAAFARTFAGRYGESIDYYQIWDEPNLDDAWGGQDPKVAEYVAMLCAGYDAIRGSDHSATVLAAALAPTAETGPENISDTLYLDDMYALGAKDCMDGAAAKPYGFDKSPDDRTINNSLLNFSRIVALREVMVKHDDGHALLWASNWGWNSLPDDWNGDASIWGEVTADERITYTLAAIDRAEREWPWLGGMILYHWQPDAAPDNPIWGFSLVNQDDSPTPLLEALQNRPNPTVAENGLYHPITEYARYSGIWTFGPLGADIGWLETSDSQLEFDFYGTSISLLLREDDYVAFLYPEVDQQPANELPQDNAGNSYIFLRSDTLEPELNLVPVARNLSDSQHTLHVVTDKGWDQWALAGYGVSSGNLAEPYNRQISMAWFTAFIAGIAVIISAFQFPWRRVTAPISGVLQRLDETTQFLISAITSIALMIAMLLTWGDGVPAILRREPVHLLLAILTAGLIYVNFHLIITILAAVVLFVLIFNRIVYGLMLTLFFAPFFLFPVELYTFAFPMVEILILITTGAWVLRIVADYARNRQSANSAYPQNSFSILFARLNAIDYGVIGLVLLAVISLSWTERLGLAFTEFRTFILEPCTFYVIVRTLKFERRDIIHLVDALLLAGVLVAAIGLVQYLTGTNFITAEDGTRRLASVYGSPNNAALFLGRCIPFALAFVLFKTGSIRRRMSAIGLMVMLSAVVLTQSVGAILFGLPGVLAVILLIVWGWRRGLLAITGLAVLGAVVLPVLTRISSRFASLLDFTQGTNFFRLRVWESAINIIRDRPITGLGLDQFLYDFRGHYIRPDAIWDRDLSHPHNFVLDFWTRLGITGVFIFFWIQLAFWRSSLRLLSRFRDTDLTLFAVMVGVVGSMANLLAHGLIDNSVFVTDLAYVFVFLLGIVTATSNISAIDHNPQ